MANDNNNHKTAKPETDDDATQIHDMSHLRRRTDDTELEMDADPIQFDDPAIAEPDGDANPRRHNFRRRYCTRVVHGPGSNDQRSLDQGGIGNSQASCGKTPRRLSV